MQPVITPSAASFNLKLAKTIVLWLTDSQVTFIEVTLPLAVTKPIKTRAWRRFVRVMHQIVCSVHGENVNFQAKHTHAHTSKVPNTHRGPSQLCARVCGSRQRALSRYKTGDSSEHFSIRATLHEPVAESESESASRKATLGNCFGNYAGNGYGVTTEGYA